MIIKPKLINCSCDTKDLKYVFIDFNFVQIIG